LSSGRRPSARSRRIGQSDPLIGKGGAERARGLRADIAGNLRRFERAPNSAKGTPAAVALVLLIDGDGRACMPMFIRAAGLARHAGQFALPGGKLDSGENASAAACRELQEELGLVATDDMVLGCLDDFDTRSGFTITPVVIWGGAGMSDLQPSQDEVAELFLLPLDELRAAVAGAARGSSRAFGLDLPWGRIYAPTAAILFQFSEVALDGRSSRVNDFYQPPFARR